MRGSQTRLARLLLSDVDRPESPLPIGDSVLAVVVVEEEDDDINLTNTLRSDEVFLFCTESRHLKPDEWDEEEDVDEISLTITNVVNAALEFISWHLDKTLLVQQLEAHIISLEFTCVYVMDKLKFVSRSNQV